MTAGHIFKKKVFRSKKWRRLKTDFQRLTYAALVACVDSWGMLPADGLTLKTTLGPFDHHSVDDYEQAINDLEGVDLVRTWKHQGDRWLYLTGHDKEQYLSKRKHKPEVKRPEWVTQDQLQTSPGELQGNSKPPLENSRASLAMTRIRILILKRILK